MARERYGQSGVVLWTSYPPRWATGRSHETNLIQARFVVDSLEIRMSDRKNNPTFLATSPGLLQVKVMDMEKVVLANLELEVVASVPSVVAVKPIVYGGMGLRKIIRQRSVSVGYYSYDTNEFVFNEPSRP